MKLLRSQRYIFKFDSTFLEMCDYNVNMDFDEAMSNNPNMVIAMGHSQLFKWIEDMYPYTIPDYAIEEQTKQKIKYTRKLGNTKENKKNIKELYSLLHKCQFEKNIVSIQFDKKKHFDNCCSKRDDGSPKLIINGQHFVRLYGTPGGLKMSTVLFINQKIYDQIYSKVNNGRNDELLYTPAKLEAYMALTSSTSNAVPTPRMIVVKGTNVKIHSDVIEIGEDKDNIMRPYNNPINNKEIEIEIDDGCGLMSPQYSRIINNTINEENETVSGVCARYAFFKGMLFTFDFNEFARDVAHKYTIIDAWGHERDVRDADVIATTSQLKLWNAYDSYEDYFENCEKNQYEFRLTKISEQLDEVRSLNYQFTQSYYLSNQDIEELIAPTVNEIKDIISLDPMKSIVYLAGSGLDEKNIFKADPVAQALMVNKELINDPYVRSRIERMIQKRIRLAKISTLDVDGNFALISGDLYAMCENYFGLEVNGILKEGETYHKFWQDKGVKEVVCMRAPMCAHYNIVKQAVKNDEKADHWFKYITDCMILNSFDTLRIAESGCDCDGDIMLTTNNTVLVNKHRKLPALDCQQNNAPKIKLPMKTKEERESSEYEISESNKKGFSNKVGSITNIGTSMLNLQSKFAFGSPEWEELEYRVMCIQHYQQLTIDSVKGIKMTPMDKSWNNISCCLPNDDDDEKTLEEKAFNKKICADKKPFFFIYRYSTIKSEYEKYVKQFDKKLRQKYRITLDQMLTSKCLTKELEKVRERYYNKCPVDLSPGTVNRIAWAVEDKFREFNQLPRVKFNKEIIKSGITYNKTEYANVRKVYEEYRSCLINLAKATNSGDVDEDDGGAQEKAMVDSAFKEKFQQACPNEQILCDILIDMLYDNINTKSVVWDMCSNVIIDNLLAKNNNMVSYPAKTNENEDFMCCRHRFKIKNICVGGVRDE